MVRFVVRFPGLGENCTINSKKIKLRKKVLKKSDATIPDALQPDARNPPNFTTGFYTSNLIRTLARKNARQQ